jgi:hypothetical protein
VTFIQYNFPDIAALSRSTRRTLFSTLLASLSLAVLGVAMRGGASGLGAAAELVQGLAQLLFIAAFAMPALAPRITRASAAEIALLVRNLTYAFAGSYAAVLSLVGLQWLLHLPTSPSALLFVTANALILAVLIWITRMRRHAPPDNRVPRTFHLLAFSYFWCSFFFIDYARIGRSPLTDPFFMLAIALLVASLVLRAAVIWTARARLAEKVG